MASYGELLVAQLLKDNGFTFQQEYEFPGLEASSGRPLRFDFAVFDEDTGDVDFLIEYQGVQHYKSRDSFGGYKGLKRQVFNDNAKREFCKKHGYKLIEIPYTEYDTLTIDYIIDRI